MHNQVEEDGTLTEGHRRHLCAALEAFEEATKAMEEAGRCGRSHTSGQKLTPLAEGDWQFVSDQLESTRERLMAAVRRYAPEYLEERERAEGTAGTLFRLSILLRHVEEEILDDLRPARMERRYGALAAEERHDLRALTDAVKADLARVRERLDCLAARRRA